MNRKNLVLIILPIVLVSACAKISESGQNILNSNASVAANANKSVTTASPAETTPSADGFAVSESGTAKASPDSGKANVQGKVLFGGKPVENIEVKLCEKFNQFLNGCDGQILTTKTDAGGEYLFANVAPRVYEALTVKVFDSKGYVFPTSGFGISASKYKIEPDKTFFVSDTNLFKDDLKVQTPKTGAKVPAQNLEVKWDAYPNAGYYEISINGDGSDYISEKIDGTSFKSEKTLSNGKYRLNVKAYNADKIKIAESGFDDIEFTVTGNDAATGNGK